MSIDRERVEIIPGKDGQFYWSVIGGNNERTNGSEGYPTDDAAIRGYRDHREIVLRNPIIVVVKR